MASKRLRPYHPQDGRCKKASKASRISRLINRANSEFHETLRILFAQEVQGRLPDALVRLIWAKVFEHWILHIRMHKPGNNHCRDFHGGEWRDDQSPRLEPVRLSRGFRENTRSESPPRFGNGEASCYLWVKSVNSYHILECDRCFWLLLMTWSPMRPRSYQFPERRLDTDFVQRIASISRQREVIHTVFSPQTLHPSVIGCVQRVQSRVFYTPKWARF